MSRPRGRKSLCTYCQQLGHNTAGCILRKADRLRGEEVDARLARMQLTPTKHPADWELVRAQRLVVQQLLENALATLSDRAPAVTHIRAALEALEDIR